MVETLAKGSRRDESDGMEARVAVLEHIAADTKEALKEIKEVLVRLEENHRIDFRHLQEHHRTDFRQLEEHQRSDFRLLLSAGAAATIALAALMAHGFHWL
jgi:hypothetical protein